MRRPLAALALVACHKHATVNPEAPLPLPPPSIPSGEVRDGVYLDTELPFTLTVPAGWDAAPGHLGQPLRVTLRDPDSDLALTVWAWHDGDEGPRPREGCSWDFQDRGHYTLPAAAGLVTVATCSPAREGGPRVFGWYLTHDDVRYALEGTVADGELGASMSALDLALGGFTWR